MSPIVFSVHLSGLVFSELTHSFPIVFQCQHFQMVI